MLRLTRLPFVSSLPIVFLLFSPKACTAQYWDGNDDDNPSTGRIVAGVVIGALAFLFFVGFLFLWQRRKSRARRVFVPAPVPLGTHPLGANPNNNNVWVSPFRLSHNPFAAHYSGPTVFQPASGGVFVGQGGVGSPFYGPHTPYTNPRPTDPAGGLLAPQPTYAVPPGLGTQMYAAGENQYPKWEAPPPPYLPGQTGGSPKGETGEETPSTEPVPPPVAHIPSQQTANGDMAAADAPRNSSPDFVGGWRPQGNQNAPPLI